MGKGFALALGQGLSICFWTLKYLPYGGWRYLPRRLLMYLLLVPLLLLLQALHWLGFAADELFFRGYRRVAVRRPIFISGVPRSGTTHLHRVLADHEDTTSMRSWECLLAPSISERYLWSGIGRVLGPLGRLGRRLRPAWLREMDAIHSLGLNEPEEDFLALLPVNACFLVVLLFPAEAALWRLARFDAAMPAPRKQAILGFYQQLVRKHLYFHGADRRYLCKNPSFASWLGSLEQTFPDADFVLCTRPARKTLPSQLSSLLPVWRLFHGPRFTPAFEQRIVGMLAGYYRDIDLFSARCERARRVPMRELTADLDGTVRALLEGLDLPLTPAYRTALAGAVEQAGRYRSGHRYQQQAFHLSWSDVAHRFDAESAEAAAAPEVTP